MWHIFILISGGCHHCGSQSLGGRNDVCAAALRRQTQDADQRSSADKCQLARRLTILRDDLIAVEIGDREDDEGLDDNGQLQFAYDAMRASSIGGLSPQHDPAQEARLENRRRQMRLAFQNAEEAHGVGSGYAKRTSNRLPSSLLADVLCSHGFPPNAREKMRELLELCSSDAADGGDGISEEEFMIVWSELDYRLAVARDRSVRLFVGSGFECCVPACLRIYYRTARFARTGEQKSGWRARAAPRLCMLRCVSFAPLTVPSPPRPPSPPSSPRGVRQAAARYVPRPAEALARARRARHDAAVLRRVGRRRAAVLPRRAGLLEGV